MALVRYNLVALALNNTVGRGKNVVANCLVSIELTGGSRATIYSDEAGTVRIPLPARCDSKGELGFWIAAGSYRIVVGGGGGGGLGTGYDLDIGGGGGFDGNYMYNASPISGDGTIIQANPLIYAIAGSGGSYGVIINYTTGLAAEDFLAIDFSHPTVPSGHNGSFTLGTESGTYVTLSGPVGGDFTLEFEIPLDFVEGETLTITQFFNYEYPEVTWSNAVKI